MPCNGIPVGSQFSSSLVDRYQRTSRLRLPSHPIGVLLWPDGPRLIVIRSSSFLTMSPSLIPPSVATGLAAYGQRRGYPARNRAVPLEQALPHVRTLFAIRETLSKKPTGKSNRTSDTRRTRHDIHAYLDSSRCSSHPFYCMLAPRLIALAQVNDVMKFKPLYSLVYIPSSRNPYHYRAQVVSVLDICILQRNV